MSHQTSLASFFAASTGSEVRWGDSQDAKKDARKGSKLSKKRPLALRKADAGAGKPAFRTPNTFSDTEKPLAADAEPGKVVEKENSNEAMDVRVAPEDAARVAKEEDTDDLSLLPFVVDDIDDFDDESFTKLEGMPLEPISKKPRVHMGSRASGLRGSRSLLSGGVESVLDLKESALTALPFKFISWQTHRSGTEDTSSLSFDSYGALLACGGTDGILSIYDFDEALYDQHKKRNASSEEGSAAVEVPGDAWAPILQIHTAKAISQVIWLPRHGGTLCTSDEVAVSYAFNSEVHVFDLSTYRQGSRPTRSYQHVGRVSGGTSCLATLHPLTNSTDSDYCLVGGGANGRITAWWSRKCAAPCWTLSLRNGEGVAALSTFAMASESNASSLKRCLVAGGDRGTIAVFSLDDLTQKAFGKGGSAAPQCIGLFSTAALLQSVMRASTLVNFKGIASMVLLHRENGLSESLEKEQVTKQKMRGGGSASCWEGGLLAITLSGGVTIALDFTSSLTVPSTAPPSRQAAVTLKSSTQRRFGIANRRVRDTNTPRVPADGKGRLGSKSGKSASSQVMSASVRCRARVVSIDLSATKHESRADRRRLTAAMPRGVWRNPSSARGTMQLLAHPKVVVQGVAMAATDMFPSRHPVRLRSMACPVRRGDSMCRILKRRQEILGEVRIGSARLVDRQLRSARQVQVKEIAGMPTAFALHPNLPVMVLAIHGVPLLASFGPAGT